MKDLPYVNNILAAHKAGVAAVNLHCAMHSYRVGQFREPVQPGSPDALWFDLLGLQSTGHGPQLPIAITVVASSTCAPVRWMWRTTDAMDSGLVRTVRICATTAASISGAGKRS